THIPLALKGLDEQQWAQAAEGIMTTDTRPKAASRQVLIKGQRVTITGISKGAGMIKPNMATMLAFIATDVALPQALLDEWVVKLADASFNRITIDGDTSTNDACVLVATGESGVELHATDAEARSEEHTPELQSRFDLVCRLLLEEK